MMDPKVISIVVAGYSEAQAKEALANNNGDVDDAIDYLYSRGRMSSRNVTHTPVFDDEDITVTDSLPPPTDAVSVASTRPYATPSFSLMTIMGTNQHARNNNSTTSSPIPLIQDQRRDAALTNTRQAAPVQTAASINNRAMHTSMSMPQPIPEDKVMWPEKKNSDENVSIKSSSSGESIPSSHRAVTRDTMTSMHLGPGAFAIGGVIETDNDGSYQPSLRNVTAEVVDPDQENQILEQRLQQELERERENAAVAEVVKESELKKCQWRRVACVVGVVLVALGVALAVALTRLPKTVQTPAPTPAPTPGPPPQEIIDLIAPVSFDEGESLMKPFSPQSKAARWLAENAHLSNYTDQRKLQRYALATFYFGTNGDTWKDKQAWLSDLDECTDWWVREVDGDEDVKLDCDANNAIQYLYIQDNNLAGSLPDEIAFLSNSMFDLRLNKNEIGGTLPPTLSMMTRLKAFYLEGNNVTGPIPTEFGLMSSLDELKVNDNLLTGSIPTEMTSMTSLDDLRLQSNNLVGTISPTMIGSLRRLDTLRLSGNDFEGSIPTEIGILTLLKELKLQENNLTGPMPSEIGLLSAMKEFACHENELTGTLPTEMGQMTALEKELRIVDNNFTGTIPTEFASFTNLGRLRMGGNQLTGTILSTLGLLHPTLNRLELQSNLLTGSIPEELGLLTLMSDLRLHANKLTGTILSEFTQFTDLKGLNFHNNSLTGTIPPFGNLTRLKDFQAGFNMLTGTIPPSIERLGSLEEFMLSNNNLTGTIPTVLFNSSIFPNLLRVNLFNNSFTGNVTCPPHIVDCYLSCFEEGNDTCRTL